jgi:hypothetical protein
VTEERPVREGDEVASEGLGRLLALADGVFAIALTLLVIDSTLPEGTSDARLGAALAALGPRSGPTWTPGRCAGAGSAAWPGPVTSPPPSRWSGSWSTG